VDTIICGVHALYSATTYLVVLFGTDSHDHTDQSKNNIGAIELLVALINHVPAVISIVFDHASVIIHQVDNHTEWNMSCICCIVEYVLPNTLSISVDDGS
jgi:hypothetical protein